MKKDWEYKTLKEISIIYGNYGLSVSSIPYNGVRYLRITDITENGELNDDKVSADISSGKTQEELQEGDILFARTGATVGKTLIYRKEFGKCLFAGYLIRYRLNKDIVIPQFIHHFTHSSGYYKWVSSNQKAAAQPNIGAKIYNELRIPLPPLSEQKEIVEYLDSSFAKIDKLKENAAKNLEEAKALFQSALKDALEPKEGWEEKKMVEVCTIERGGSPRPIKKFLTKEENGLNWIKIGDTDPQGKYIYSTAEKIIPEGLKKSRWVDVDDFLLSNSMSFGRPYILKTNGCIHDGWLVLRNYQNFMNIDFFYYLLISPLVQRQFKIKAQGSTVSNLNTQRVADVAICIPPLPEQQSIVSFLDSLSEKVNTLQQNYSRICDECDALKQAILRQVFE